MNILARAAAEQHNVMFLDVSPLAAGNFSETLLDKVHPRIKVYSLFTDVLFAFLDWESQPGRYRNGCKIKPYCALLG